MKDKLLASPTKIRNIVQVGFALFLIYLGYRFYLWVEYYRSGIGSLIERPAGVEGFLPVAALVGLKNWLVNGVFDYVHPAGLVIFLTISLVSLLCKKAFCGWLCPIGTLAEFLGRTGQKVLGRNYRLPIFLDYMFMIIKYILLGFFIVFIFVLMDGQSVSAFIGSPYNAVADIKMLDFFLNISGTKLYVILGLMFISLIIRNFWCRYLCPYGALLGLFSWLSPTKIKRDEHFCLNCGRCSSACPNRIKVAEVDTVSSVECNSCLDCVGACPEKKALGLKTGRIPIKSLIYPILILGTFMFIVIAAKLTGHWQSSLTQADYRQIIPYAQMIEH